MCTERGGVTTSIGLRKRGLKFDRLRCFAWMAIAICALVASVLGARIAVADSPGWAVPINVSSTPNQSWFPDIAIDRAGRVHVIWCETTGLASRTQDERLSEQVFYTVRDDRGWTVPNDIVEPQQEIRRNAIAVGAADEVLMVFLDTKIGGTRAVFSSASASAAWSADAWTERRLVTAHSSNYMVDLAVDLSGVYHLLFDDQGEQASDEDFAYSDMYYRRSESSGDRWQPPTNLSRTSIGCSRGQLAVEPRGVLHATWDEGWDRLSGHGRPNYSVYRSSADGGLTWSFPITVSHPTSGTIQLTAGADGNGGVMLVWRNMNFDHIYYQWSIDYGKTWSEPQAIIGIYARPWDSPFDLYSMISDSSGAIHLVAAARESLDRDASIGMYHLMWDGSKWSRPVCIFCGFGLPEYPRLSVSEGNQLHCVWFVRDDLWGGGNYEVWYSELTTAAPRQTPRPVPTATSTVPPLPTATLTSTTTPFPTLAASEQGIPSNLQTESDEVRRLALAIAPLAGGILLMAMLRGLRRRRR